MDTGTRDMLGKVDKRISNLQEIRRLIVEEFGDATASSESANTAHEPAARRTPRRKSGGQTKNGPARKIQIHEWLKNHGPSGRKEIITGTGFPNGTVGSLLSQCHDLFENRDGKWLAR